MNDLTIGILLGAFLYSTYITLVAVITQDEDSIIVCGISSIYLYNFIIIPGELYLDKVLIRLLKSSIFLFII